jgi:hypothetical protein
MLVLEIQRGKLPMRELPYHADLGATAACTRRLCESAAYAGAKLASRRHAAESNLGGESFIGDSWFTGIPAVESAAEAGHEYFGALKTNTKGTPYQELIDKMKDYPSGANLVMECHSPRGHDLICIGYKYSARKVLVFLGTKNSGSTKLGEPYIARFPDINGNVAQRSVPRPDVISKYFKDSNAIDSHNQARQSEIALEKHWITHTGWFRIATTLIGMTVTDCWRAYKHHMPLKKHKELPIKVFADRIALDCCRNCHLDIFSPNGYLAPEDENIPQTVGGSAADDVSAITEPTTASTTSKSIAGHIFKDNPELEPPNRNNGKTRPKRRRCPACTEENQGKGPGEKKRNALTAKMCFHPQCLERRYWASGRWVYGVFYCPDHYQCHYSAILEGRGNV